MELAVFKSTPPAESVVMESLPSVAQAYVRARLQSRTVTDLWNENAEATVDLVSKVISDGIKMLGHWKQTEQVGVIEFMQEKMITFLMGKYRHVTIHEFKLAVEKLCAGDFKKKNSDILTISVESMCFSLDSLLKEEIRKMALVDFDTKLRIAHQAPKVEVTPDQARMIVREGCNKAWEWFKQDGTIPEKCCPYYDELKRTFNITWSPEEYAQIKQQATEIYRNRIRQERQMGNISKGIYEAKNSNSKDAILIECKRICLRILFERSKDKPFK